MSCGKEEDLAAEFQALVHEISTNDADQQETAISSWLERVSLDCLQHATRLVQIYRARSQILCPTGNFTQYIVHVHIHGDVFMGDESRKNVDQSTHVTSGGDATGIAGTGARIEHSVIQTFKDGVKQSGNIDQTGADLFKQVLDEIDRCADGDVQKEALEELKKLRTELEKAQPKETLVKKSFNALKTFVALLPTVAKIGEWIGTKFGWVLL